jgi:arginine decarboxylase
MKKAEEVSSSQPTAAEAPQTVKPWTTADSTGLYHIDTWGNGHFSINDQGNIICSPLLGAGANIPLMAVVDEARKRGISFPLQIRFHDLLKHRVRSINLAFKNAIEEIGYQNYYQGVFPIKVNQLREVVEEILDAGREFNYGLEAGSKPELVASLAMLETSNSLIICNGYKDEQFVRLALLGCKIGRKVILVVEKMDELHLVMKFARILGVTPVIGFRIRLSSKGHGKWAESGGENAKFGLSVSEALEAWEILQDQGFHQSVQLLHFHIGSQVPDVMHIKKAVREAARYYSKFVQLGEPLKYLDVGGGLAIDYDGSGSPTDSSMIILWKNTRARSLKISRMFATKKKSRIRSWFQSREDSWSLRTRS